MTTITVHSKEGYFSVGTRAKVAPNGDTKYAIHFSDQQFTLQFLDEPTTEQIIERAKSYAEKNFEFFTVGIINLKTDIHYVDGAAYSSGDRIYDDSEVYAGSLK